MKVALLGATGFVGSALLKEALDRGHTVSAIVRDPEKLEKRDGLIPRRGDVYDTASLVGLIEGNDALISAFNPGWKNPNLYDDQVRGTKSIIAAVKKAGIKRVLWVGGAGGLEVKPGVRVVDDPALPDWVRPGSLATIDALDQLRKEPDLEWTFLTPSAEMKPGERHRKVQIRGRPALNRLCRPQHNFGAGFCGSHDRRTGAPASCPSALHSGILTNQ